MFSYRIFIWLYPRLIRVASLFNPKARRWVRGRRDIFLKLTAAFRSNKAPVIWMHTASLGEFEQGLPVLEALRKTFPDHTLLVTFFSPSGYEIRKNHPVPDHIFYLPMDSPSNATRFVQLVKPSLVLFVKYEFWHYYLAEIHRRNIPLLLVSGIFRGNQVFFQWYGGHYRRMLSYFSALLVQNAASAELLSSLQLPGEVMIAGDTRFDRVVSIAESFTPVDAVARFCAGRPVIVAGSTWTEDDEALDHFANSRTHVALIVAPHDIDEERLEECERLYKHAVRLSLYQSYPNNATLPTELQQANVLIIDNIGMLSKLYHYATIAYVGGGFGDDGIHNILEAAVFHKPVVFGPVYDKYAEAEEMLDAGGAFSIEDAIALEKTLDQLLSDKKLLTDAGSKAGEFVRAHAGATEAVMTYIRKNVF